MLQGASSYTKFCPHLVLHLFLGGPPWLPWWLARNYKKWHCWHCMLNTNNPGSKATIIIIIIISVICWKFNFNFHLQGWKPKSISDFAHTSFHCKLFAGLLMSGGKQRGLAHVVLGVFLTKPKLPPPSQVVTRKKPGLLSHQHCLLSYHMYIRGS